MKNTFTFLFVLSLSFSAAAQSDWFAPIGAKWLYLNEGKDTAVRHIQIERIQDTMLTRKWANLEVRYLDVNDQIKFKENYVIDLRLIIGFIQVLIPREPPQEDRYNRLFWLDTFQHPTKFPTTVYNIFRSDKPHPYTIRQDSVGGIVINGFNLMVNYFSGVDSAGQHCYCVSFCSPIIQRIGPIGYFMPMDVCAQDTVYAGRLISYQDSAFGLWVVPDSLRGPCSYDQQAAAVTPMPLTHSISIYPNPFTSSITVDAFQIPGAEIQVYDVTGTLRRRHVMRFPEETLDLSFLPTGIYFLRIANSNTMITRKITKL